MISLWIWIFPFNSKTNSLTILKPKPVPLVDLCKVSSTWKNGLKILDWFSNEIPIPVSLIMISKQLFFYLILQKTKPIKGD